MAASDGTPTKQRAMAHRRSWGSRLIAVAGWFGAISPQLSSTSSLQAQTQSAQDENLALQSKISKLRRESATLPLLTSELRNLLAALPSDSGLPQFTRQVTAQAARQGVGLTSITVGSISAANGKSTVGGSGRRLRTATYSQFPSHWYPRAPPRIN